MYLQQCELNFHKITHHTSVIQCLGSVGSDVLYHDVSKPSILNEDEIVTISAQGKEFVRSKCGHYYVPPHPDYLQVFQISGYKFLKLHIGTCVLVSYRRMDFYNFELSNTNVRIFFFGF